MLLMRESDNVTHYGNAQSHSTLFSMQETIPQSGREERQGLSSVSKRILIVDDDPDITFTFKKGLEAKN
jgi:hypothetical protein